MAALLRKGSRLGKYRLERRLGRGSFAEVWRARDRVEHRHVALKVTHPEAVSEWGRDAIEREARETPDLVREAPHRTPRSRLDETRAARRQVLRWQPS